MPEKKRTPHQSREEMRGVSQSKGHLHDKSAEELLTELEAKLDSMTDQTYDEDLVDAYLEALDEKAPLPKQFDVESSWNQFRSKHSILFDADDILPNPKHSRSFSHKFRFRKAIPQLVAAAAIVGVLGMFGAQAAGIDVFGALGRWTEETFHFVAPKASAAPTYHTVSNGDGFYELEQYSTLQDAFDAYSISDPLAPSWIPEGYTLDYVEVSPSDICREHGMMANIEIKPTTGTGPLTGKMVALAARQLWAGMTPPLLSSFEIDALEAAQQAVPELPRGLLLDEWRDDWRELTARLGCVSIHLNHKLLDKVRVMQLKDAGLRILVYTVNKPQRAAELLRWGVDCICTDAIDVIGPNFTAQ